MKAIKVVFPGSFYETLYLPADARLSLLDSMVKIVNPNHALRWNNKIGAIEVYIR